MPRAKTTQAMNDRKPKTYTIPKVGRLVMRRCHSVNPHAAVPLRHARLLEELRPQDRPEASYLGTHWRTVSLPLVYPSLLVD